MKKHLLLTLIFLVYFLQKASAVTYTVNSTSDANTGNAAINTGTLRWCMNQANLAAGSHTVNFNIPGAAPYVINIGSTLPTFNNAGNNITIDATTQPGYVVGVPVIIIRGKAGLAGMQIQNSNATGHVVKGLIFQILSTGISITGGSNHGIYGCWFGINDAGNSKVGVTIEKNGIEVSNSQGVKIGGTNAGEGNVISGCANVTAASQGTFAGLYVSGGNTNNTRITGNYVGTDATGTLGGPNLGNGALEYFHQNGITISGTNNSAVFIRNNVISNNFSSGIRVIQDNSWIGSNNVTITGNFIGTDKNGMLPLGNGTAGIWASESQNLTIGGNTAALANVISANGKTTVPNVTNTQNATEWDWYNSAGIYCDNISNSTIKGNFVGTDITGSSSGVAQSMGNLYAGIKIKAYGGTSPKNLTIGGTTAADGNIIGGNGYRSFAANASYPGHGILLQGTTVNGVNVYKNLVGISPSGLNIGNKQDGISLQDGVQNCNIGGPNLGNITSNNTFGVFLQKNCNNNTISSNFVGTNASGTAAAGNSQGGICLQQLSNSNTISTNIIGGNSAAAGIIIRNGGSPAAPANNNNIQSNIIGATAGGAALPNLIGIYIEGGSTGTIVSANTIKSNTTHGISLDKGQASRIISNIINDNGGNGIDLANGSSNNIIGGASSEANNITANAGHGIGFSAPNTAGSVNNAIDRNTFSCNGARGINLNGGNANLAAPKITGAPESFNVSASGGWIELYRIDACYNCNALSSNPGAIINNLQGATLVLEGPAGSAIWNNINPATYGGTTNKDFTAIVSSAAPSITAGTTTAHNTSEFSPCASLCVLAKPTVTASANAICIGASDTLTANTTDTGVTFTWYKTSVTTANKLGTGQTFVFSPSTTTSYIVVATKTDCAADTSAPFAIIVNPNPSVIVNASSTSICSKDGSTTLSAVVSGSTATPFTYTWSANPSSSPIPGNVSSADVSPIVSTDYSLVVTDANGCSNHAATKAISVSTYVQADAGSDQSLCAVSSANLSATNPSPATGQWTPIAGTPSSVVVSPENSLAAKVTGLSAGTTKLVWTVTSGVCISRDTVEIEDYTNVTTADAGPDTVDLCNVSNTTLSGVAVGGVGHWTILSGPGNLSNPDNATTAVNGLVPGSTTVVEWKVVNGACWKSDTVSITDYRSVIAAVAGAHSHSLCNEIKDTLTAVAPTLGTGKWSIITGQGTIVNPDKNETTITGLHVPDTIIARWTVKNGACEARDSITIINYQKIDSVFAGTDHAVCNQTIASISGNVPVVGTGSWSKLNPGAPGTITFPNAPQTTITGLSYNVPVELIWKITNGACKAEDTVKVTANDQQPANAGPNHYLCVDSLVILAAVPPAQGYGRWFIVTNPSSAYFVNGNADSSNSQAKVHVPLGYTEFEWKIFNGGCMGATSSRTLVVRDTIPTIANAGSDASSCDSDSIQLHGNKAFIGRGKWHAAYDSTLVFDNLYDSLTWVHNLKIGSNIVVWTIHSPYGLCDSISDTVNVIRMHVAFAADSINVCYGSLPVFFGDTLYALPGNYNYKWTIDIPGAVVNDTNYFIFPFEPSLVHAGIDSLPAPSNNYWVKLQVGGLSCFVKDSVFVQYHKLPEASLTAGKDTICLGASLDLVAGSNVKPIAYAWSNNIGTLEDTIITRLNPYTRNVESDANTLVAYYVTVLDSNGCWSLPAMDTVRVIQHQDLVIPNLMTPNGDDKNDTYVIRDINKMDLLPGATLEVYNRWGERVFKSTNYRNDWAARNVNDGIYYYYLKSGCGPNAYKGWLQIISNEKNVEGF